MGTVTYTVDDIPNLVMEFESMLRNTFRLRFPEDSRTHTIPLRHIISLLEEKKVISDVLASEVRRIYAILHRPADGPYDIKADVDYINSHYDDVMDSLHHARFTNQ